MLPGHDVHPGDPPRSVAQSWSTNVELFGDRTIRQLLMQGMGPLVFGAIGQLADAGPALALAGCGALCLAAVWAVASRSRGASAVSP
jgi:hypothetical protein